jgi:hypothetical protein
MATSVASLWPTDIQPTVQSPFAILDGQARELTRITNGILVGDVKVARTDDQHVIVTLDIVVPALDNYRHRILQVTHGLDMIYPAWIEADCFVLRSVSQVLAAQSDAISRVVNAQIGVITGQTPQRMKNEAYSDQELRQLLKLVFDSEEVKPLAVSLIARANDVIAERNREAETLNGVDLATTGAAPDHRND